MLQDKSIISDDALYVYCNLIENYTLHVVISKLCDKFPDEIEGIKEWGLYQAAELNGYYNPESLEWGD